MNSATSQYCPNCGASNPIDATECRVCGQSLPSAQERQELWSTRGDATPHTNADAPGEAAEGARDAAGGDGPGDEPLPGDRAHPTWEQQDTQPLEAPAAAPADPGLDQDAHGAASWSAEPPPGDTRPAESGWGAAPRGTSGAGAGTSSWPAAGATWRRPLASDPPEVTREPAGPGAGQQWSEHADPYRAAGAAELTQDVASPADTAGWPATGYGDDRYRMGTAGWGPAPGESGGGQSPYGYGIPPTGGYAAGAPQWGPAASAQRPSMGMPAAAGRSGGPVAPPPAGGRGPSGCLLGGLGVVLIVLAAAVLVGLVVINNATGDHLRGSLQNVAATQIASIGPVAAPSGGRLTVSAANLTSVVRQHTDQYGAIHDPTVDITPAGLALDFEVVGVGSSYHAGVMAENGHLRLTNPTASGAAARVLSADDMASVIELSLNQILTQSGLEATDVELGQGQMTIMTRPVARAAGSGTPAAMSGSPSASPSVSPSDPATPRGARSGSLSPSPSGQIRPSGLDSSRPSASATVRPSSSAQPSGSGGLGGAFGGVPSPFGSASGTASTSPPDSSSTSPSPSTSPSASASR